MNLNIATDSITVSGISSGAYMATQMHIAYSSLIKGSVGFSGGPFACAKEGLGEAISNCMQGTNGGPNIQRSAALIVQLSEQAKIDNVDNLANSRVLSISGLRDTVVARNVSRAATELFRQFVRPENIQHFELEQLGHGFPTLNFGNPCDTHASPFLLACGYDGAGNALDYLYSNLQPRSDVTTSLITLEDNISGYSDVLEMPYVYVPAACQQGAECKLHIVLHGCQQNREYVGDVFARNAGYNEWAETNNIVVLYPQTGKSLKNPQACWDWWGYSDDSFYDKQAPQLRAIRNLIAYIRGENSI